MSSHGRKEKKTTSAYQSFGLCVVMACQLALLPEQSAAFAIPQNQLHIRSLQLQAVTSSADDEITKQLERAKKLIEETKAKMEEKEQQEAEEALSGESAKGGDVPFFARKTVGEGNKKEKVTKTQNEEGLITTDGEMMAKMSEAEEWEVRPLLEVFEDERKDVTPDPFADRDVAANIFNLRKTLQTEDYQKIFDKRNRWIGEQ